MDNQQVKDYRIAYFAGFFDGEGHLSISLNKSAGYPRLQPVVCFTNTNLQIIEEIERFLDDYNVHYHHGVHKRQKRTGGKHKDCHVIEIKRYGAIFDLLTYLIDYLIVKRLQAFLVMEFCKKRLNYYNDCGQKLKHAPTSDWDFRARDLLMSLNKNGASESSEAIRQTNPWLDDIVQAHTERVGLLHDRRYRDCSN